MDEDVSESSHCDCLVRVANFSIPNKPSYCSQVLKSIQSLMDGRMLVFGKNNVCKLAIAFGAKLPVCLLVILERMPPNQQHNNRPASHKFQKQQFIDFSKAKDSCSEFSGAFTARQLKTILHFKKCLGVISGFVSQNLFQILLNLIRH